MTKQERHIIYKKVLRLYRKYIKEKFYSWAVYYYK